MNREMTQILEAVAAGEAGAMDELMARVYAELRDMAASRLARERPGHTLQPTALVNEVYLRILGAENSPQWRNRRVFFKAAADAMQRILVDNARRRKSAKRNAAHFADTPPDFEAPLEDLLDLEVALAELALKDAEVCEVVKLHYFAGLPMTEIAELLGVNVRTAQRTWAFARAWLYQRLNAPPEK